MADLPFNEGLTVLAKRALRAKVAIWVVIASSILTAAGQFMEASGSIDLDAPGSDATTLLVALGYLTFGVSYLVSVVLVAMWIHRAHANLFAAGLHDLEYTPGWSVGWFFVPFANLVKPFQAMRELWNASYGTDNSFGSVTPTSVGIWWGCFIGGNIILNVSSRFDNGAADPAVGQVLGGAAILILVGSAWFLLQVIREVMEGQRNHLQVAEAFS